MSENKFLQPIRGTHDLLGGELDRHCAIEKIALDTAKIYGYSQIRTPIIENSAVFSKPLGPLSDIVSKEMYTFEDHGGESITLRPEGTAPIMRAIINAGLTQTLPQKFITIGPFFRYERPQKGRMRQLHQISVEYVGVAEPEADAEIICFGNELLKKSGVENYQLQLNTLGDNESRLSYRDKLISFFNKHKDSLSPLSQLRLQQNPLRILDSKELCDKNIISNAPEIMECLTSTSKFFFEKLQKLLQKLEIPYQINNQLVRGLDYYCHTVFEFVSAQIGSQSTILGGGRYDGLMNLLGGPALPAVGFGCGIERLSLAAKDLPQSLSPKRICILPNTQMDSENSLYIAQKFRLNNIPCELLLNGKLQKRISMAEKIQCSWILIVGTNEIEKNIFQLKSLERDNDEKITGEISSIINYLKNL